MPDTLLCLDVETVPETALLPADWPADRFPPPHAHRVVAVSFVEAEIERTAAGERYRVRACRSGGEVDYDEERLLRGFWQHFARVRPRLVTWNGRGFDMAVLRLRAMVHGLSAAAWYETGDRWNGYGQRYSPDFHCDLMDVLSDHGAAPRLGLQDVARALGLPGKVGGHGSEVAGMVARGEIEAVRAYCESDVLNLFAAYVRWALLSGRTDPVGHNVSIDTLVDLLARERAERPHFGAFLDLWQASDRPRPMHVPVPRPALVRDLPHLDSEGVLP